MDEALYNTNALFPAEEYRVLGTQYQNGYAVLIVNWYPYRYNPVQGVVQWNESVSFELETHFDQQTYDHQNAFLLSGDAGLRKLSNAVIERQNLATYSKTATVSSRSLVTPGEPYQMIIITNDQAESYLDGFVAWKTDHGIIPKVISPKISIPNIPVKTMQLKFAPLSQTPTPHGATPLPHWNMSFWPAMTKSFLFVVATAKSVAPLIIKYQPTNTSAISMATGMPMVTIYTAKQMTIRIICRKSLSDDSPQKPKLNLPTS